MKSDGLLMARWMSSSVTPTREAVGVTGSGPVYVTHSCRCTGVPGAGAIVSSRQAARPLSTRTRARTATSPMEGRVAGLRSSKLRSRFTSAGERARMGGHSILPSAQCVKAH